MSTPLNPSIPEPDLSSPWFHEEDPVRKWPAIIAPRRAVGIRRAPDKIDTPFGDIGIKTMKMPPGIAGVMLDHEGKVAGIFKEGTP